MHREVTVTLAVEIAPVTCPPDAGNEVQPNTTETADQERPDWAEGEYLPPLQIQLLDG